MAHALRFGSLLSPEYYKMTDLIYTHLSARVPDEDGTFLINRYGEIDEVTASSLVKMDMKATS